LDTLIVQVNLLLWEMMEIQQYVIFSNTLISWRN